MAGGNLSPRQKMINMMYLVLTALLALNISKDILESLTKLNDGLSLAVESVETKNAEMYNDFIAAAETNPAKAAEWRDKAMLVKKQADDLDKYIDELKHTLILESGGYADDMTPEEGKGTDLAKALDQKEKPAHYLLNQGNAEKLKLEFDNFRNSMVSFVDKKPALQTRINESFNTADQSDKHGSEAVKLKWEKATFEHFPLAAILPFLTNYQSKIRNTETEVLNVLKENISAKDVKFNTIEAVVVARSNYVTQGSPYTAEVFLAAYDDTQVPTISIDGEPLDASSIVKGRGMISRPTSAAGQQTWGGFIEITQLGQDDPIRYEIPEQTYTVAPPSVVISPTKMNVFYRGVQNPVDIAVPGVDPSKLRVTGGGIRKTAKGYEANVDNIKGQKTVKVNVSVEETDPNDPTKTKLVSYGSKEFRIKGLPLAVGKVYQKRSTMLSPGAIKKLTVEAKFEDFPFDLPITVTAFEIAIPGFPPEKVKGNRLNSNIKARIGKLKPGSVITIRKIKASGPNNLRVTKISDISIDVN